MCINDIQGDLICMAIEEIIIVLLLPTGEKYYSCI